MKKIGYLRVSTSDQRPDRQLDGLGALCDELHVEVLSATSKCRPVYEQVIGLLEPGDTFVIWDLDRAYRSARDALNELERMRDRGIEIQIANLSIDTSTPHGLLLFTVVSGLAEFERRLLSQRTKEGLAAARRRGKRLGRPPKMSQSDLRDAVDRIKKNESLTQIARDHNLTAWSLSRALRRSGLY